MDNYFINYDGIKQLYEFLEIPSGQLPQSDMPDYHIDFIVAWNFGEKTDDCVYSSSTLSD